MTQNEQGMDGLPPIMQPVEDIDPGQAETIEAQSGHGPEVTVERVQGTGEFADLNNKQLNTVLADWREERNNGGGTAVEISAEGPEVPADSH